MAAAPTSVAKPDAARRGGAENRDGKAHGRIHDQHSLGVGVEPGRRLEVFVVEAMEIVDVGANVEARRALDCRSGRAARLPRRPARPGEAGAIPAGDRHAELALGVVRHVEAGVRDVDRRRARKHGASAGSISAAVFIEK